MKYKLSLSKQYSLSIKTYGLSAELSLKKQDFNSNQEINLYTDSAITRKLKWMPLLDGYVLREFLIPFSALLFAFCLLFIISDVF